MNKVKELFDTNKLPIIDIVEKFGVDHQIDKCIEKMSELTKALIKHRNLSGSYRDVCEEIADVIIMMYQLTEFYSADDDIEVIMESKIKRLKRLVHGQDYTA